MVMTIQIIAHITTTVLAHRFKRRGYRTLFVRAESKFYIAFESSLLHSTTEQETEKVHFYTKNIICFAKFITILRLKPLEL
jgi:hypothetical protein